MSENRAVVAGRAVAAGLLLLSVLVFGGCGGVNAAEVSPGELEPGAPAKSKVPYRYVAPQAGLDVSSAEKSLATETVTATGAAGGGASGSSPGASSVGKGFPTSTALAHIRYLADRIGVREAGTRGEAEAAAYIAGQLKKMGYKPAVEEFLLPDGRTSRNVVATKPGRTSETLVLGAHMDTKAPSPGANDNASGVGTTLALAQALASQQIDATVQFVFFGAEERVGEDPNAHHLGSRHRVAQTGKDERARIAGMISVDMVGFGDKLHTRTMYRGPQTISQDLLAYARSRGVTMSYLRDQGKTGQSDHEPYEVTGIPAVWVEVRDDPAYHTKSDVSRRIDQAWIGQVGQLLLDYVKTRSAADLKAL